MTEKRHKSKLQSLQCSCHISVFCRLCGCYILNIDTTFGGPTMCPLRQCVTQFQRQNLNCPQQRGGQAWGTPCGRMPTSSPSGCFLPAMQNQITITSILHFNPALGIVTVWSFEIFTFLFVSNARTRSIHNCSSYASAIQTSLLCNLVYEIAVRSGKRQPEILQTEQLFTSPH